MDQRIIVITGESAWLVTTSADGLSGYVNGRASFGQHMPTDHNYEGSIITGPDGLNLRPGTCFVFQCQCGQSHTGWGSGGIVTSGIITRVVNHADLPEEPRESEENGVHYIRLTPSWGWLMPFVEGNFDVRSQASRAFDLADLLVTLVDMGRVTQEDLQAAKARRAQG